MAATKHQATPALHNFQRLNHKTYLYDPAAPKTDANGTTHVVEPTAQRAPQATGTPALVLLCSWMDASPRHVEKYTTYYQTLYPASPILLVTSSTRDFFFNTSARQARELAPALAVIREHCSSPATSSSDGGGGNLLVHALSNGGCGHLAMISTLYARTTGGAALPASAVIYDSAPGQSRFVQGFTAMSMGLPAFPLVRWPLQALVAVLLLVFFHLPPLVGVKTLSMEMSEVLNDGRLLRKQAPRTYAYSAADAIIMAQDVEDHAREAEGGGLVVRREVFEGTPHVGHMRKEPERYWEMVAVAWELRA